MCSCTTRSSNPKMWCSRCKAMNGVGEKEIDLTLTDSKETLYNSIDLLIGSIKGLYKSIHIIYRMLINKPITRKVWDYDTYTGF